jgi:hypothetical protein
MLFAARFSTVCLTLRKYILLASQSHIVAIAVHDSLSFIQNHAWNPRLTDHLTC